MNPVSLNTAVTIEAAVEGVHAFWSDLKISGHSFPHSQQSRFSMRSIRAG